MKRFAVIGLILILSGCAAINAPPEAKVKVSLGFLCDKAADLLATLKIFREAGALDAGDVKSVRFAAESIDPFCKPGAINLNIDHAIAAVETHLIQLIAMEAAKNRNK